MLDGISTRKVYPIVLVFSKIFFNYVTKKKVQPIINIAKERMSRNKVDPPAQVMLFIVDEVIANHYHPLTTNRNYNLSKIAEDVVEKNHHTNNTLKHISN
jgi:hypothetical protein